jgi:predicted GNAT family acetyltransferase
MAQDKKTVIRNVSERRFEVEGTGGAATLTYYEGPGHITLVHTEVAPELEGKGYGGLLARAALDYARSAKLRVIPACKFVRTFIERHPEYADLVTA